MKRCIFIFALAATFASCKKKDDEPVCPNTTPTPVTVTPANNYIKLAVGNYWIYDQYSIDVNQVETYVGTDSAYVSADTIIHGDTFYKLFDLYFTEFLRDSSGFIVGPNGAISFTNVVFNIPLAFNYYGGSIGYNEQMTVSTPVSVTVPAGTFTAYDWKITSHFTDPNYTLGAIRYAHDYYSENVGKVKHVYFFYSQPGYYERRLVRYHVQ